MRVDKMTFRSMVHYADLEELRLDEVYESTAYVRDHIRRFGLVVPDPITQWPPTETCIEKETRPWTLSQHWSSINTHTHVERERFYCELQRKQPSSHGPDSNEERAYMKAEWLRSQRRQQEERDRLDREYLERLARKRELRKALREALREPNQFLQFSAPPARKAGVTPTSEPKRIQDAMATQAVPFQAFSLEDDAFVQGGLLQDVDVEITDAQWVPWDYGGKSANVTEDVLALRCMLQVLGEDQKPRVDSQGQAEAAVEQFWSAGGPFSAVIVSSDNRMVGATENKSALTKGSNTHLFLQSLRATGMPKGYLEDGNVGKLMGVRFHLIRKTFKRDGLQMGRANRDQDPTTAICGSIIWGPWMGGQPAKGRAAAPRVNGPVPVAAPTGAPAAQAAPAAAPDADTEAHAERLVRTVMEAEPDKTIDKLSNLKVKVFRMATADKSIPVDKRNAIGKLAESKQWLEERGLVIEADGKYTLV